MLPNAYSHVTVSDKKLKSAHAFMCVCGGGVCVCVCVCVHGVGRFLLQSPEMQLTFLLQFISR